MIETINNISSIWFPKLISAQIQNGLFLLILFFLLYAVKNINASTKRTIALIGFIKLLLPPFRIKLLDSITSQYQLPTIIVNPSSQGMEQLTLTFESLMLLLWVGIATTLFIIMISNTQNLKRKLGILKPIDQEQSVFISKKNHSPMVLGFFKPIVILPVTYNELSSKWQNIVMSHELTHKERLDPLVKLISGISLSLNLFNPLAWFLYFKLDDYIEMSCDDIVQNKLEMSSKELSNSLLNSTILFSNGIDSFRTSLSFSTTNSKIKKRITYQLIKKEKRMKKYHSQILIIIVIVASILFSVQCNSKMGANNQNEQTDDSIIEVTSDNLVTSDNIMSSDVIIKTDESKKSTPKGSTIVSDEISITKSNQPVKSYVKVDYPEDARVNNESGKVMVKAIVNSDGKVISTEITESVSPSLDKTAEKAVKTMSFEKSDIETREMSIPIQFNLK